MKEITPSKHFTDQVMDKVRQYHAQQTAPARFTDLLFESRPCQLLLGLVASWFALLNLGRILFSLFSPVLCK
ncbi:MAG: hypothetical protein D6B25_13280 [Desulfobulbaceae bacterium]|nr:MAG: hypothetical protein D6B25_13280 [Desulfobulbaceae bacterium]